MNKYDHYPSLRLYDRLGVPYVLTSERWEGPLWTGHCMMLSIANGYGDEGFAHELFHWIVASPRQRMMPDFALGQQVNARYGQTFATSTTPHYFSPDNPSKRIKGHNTGWGERTVARDTTASRQEADACYAMFLYYPLTGQLGWDQPQGGPAAYDFAGSHYPGSPEWRTSTVVKRVMPIVTALDQTITTEQVSTYLGKLHSDALAEQDSW